MTHELTLALIHNAMVILKSVFSQTIFWAYVYGDSEAPRQDRDPSVFVEQGSFRICVMELKHRRKPVLR